VRVLLDQGVPRRAAALLREAGIDAIHAAEVDLSRADDRSIITWCRINGAVIVTLDADFHAWIALAGATSPSAIRIRIQGLKGPDVARLLLPVLRSREADLIAGSLVTIQHGRLRLRRLPVSQRKP